MTRLLPNHRLREGRQLRGWSQSYIAEQIGAPASSYISRWERGIVSPGPYYQQKLCTLFCKNAAELGFFQHHDDADHEPEVAAWEYDQEEQGVTSSLQAFPGLHVTNGRRSLPAERTPVLPVASPFSQIWHVPYQRNPFFTGRETLLGCLHELLSERKTATVIQTCALCGLGGIGKTQIAIEYAYRRAQEYMAVLWIAADTYETFLSSVVTISHLLQLSEGQRPEQGRVMTAFIQWLNSHQDWLLICDNVEQMELVKPLLSTSRKGSLLLTTRLQALGTLALSLEVQQMSPEEGARFLLRRIRLEPRASSDQCVPSDYATARAISEAMGGLPLALDQAGAYLEETSCGLTDFLPLFEGHSTQLLNERNGHSDHPLSVAKTFALSFEKLQEANPAAVDLLTACSFLAPDTIPEQMLIQSASYWGPMLQPVLSNPLQLNASIKDLLAYSLVRRCTRTKTLSVHRLVQAVCKERLSEALQREWACRAIQAMDAIFPISSLSLPT